MGNKDRSSRLLSESEQESTIVPSNHKSLLIANSIFFTIFLVTYASNYYANGSMGFFGINAYFTNISLGFSLVLQFLFLIENIFAPLRKTGSKFHTFLKKILIMSFTFTGMIFPIYWILLAYFDFKGMKDCRFPNYCRTYSIVAHFLTIFPPWVRISKTVVKVNWSDFLYPLTVLIFYTFYLAYWSLEKWPPYYILTFKNLGSYLGLIGIGGISFLSFWLGKKIGMKGYGKEERNN